MADSDSVGNVSRSTQQLFVASGLFPSATSVGNKVTDSDDDLQENGGQGLESLQLDLAPSTLQAILAAQKQPVSSVKKESPIQVIEESDESDESLDLVSTEVSRKRRKSSSADEKNSPLEKRKKEKGKERYKEKKAKKSKKHKHKHKHRKHRSRSPSPQSAFSDLPLIPKEAVFMNDVPDLKPGQAFVLDKKANKNLWHYQSVSKLHIPKYRTYSFNCLGKPDISAKDPKSGKDGDSKRKSSRYFGKLALRQSRKRGSHISSQMNKNETATVREYISLPKESAEESSTSTALGSYSCLDEATALYAQGKGTDYSKPQELESEDLVMDEIFHKVAQFNQKVREDPQNIQLWLDFVRFQDTVVQEDKSFRTEDVRLKEVYQPTRAVIEKKLSILEKALEANPSSLELRLAQLEQFQDIWDAEKLEKAWEDLLFIHPANVDLWRQYLCRQQSRLSRFSFGHMVKCYHKCFKKLVLILDGQVTARNKPADLEEKIIDLFSQYCSFLHQAGYTERAVCSFQALIEFNLFCPLSHNLSSTQQRTQGFEEFWESGTPKFGEPHAKGWAKWTDDDSDNAVAGAELPSVSTDELEDAVVQESFSRAMKWLKMEKIRQNAHWLPWRPDESKGDTEEDCEDPDRLVLYDDISPVLFRITKSQSCFRIVCLFLNFLGLTSQRIDKRLDECCEDCDSQQFTQYSLTSLQQTPYVSLFFSNSVMDSKWKPKEYLLSFLQEILQQAECYFVGSNRTLFTLLRLDLEVVKCGATKVSELQKSDRKELKKFGKNLLKEMQNRNNLVVWEAYIRVLWASSDKMSETVSMIDVALGMFLGSTTMSDPEKELGLCHLCKTYSQILLNFEPLEHIGVRGRHSEPSAEDKKQVMACLGALMESKSFKSVSAYDVSPAFILRIRKRFEKKIEELRDSFIAQPCPTSADVSAAFVDCFALFEFCASDLKTANLVYSSVRENIKSHQKKDMLHQPFSFLIRDLYLSQISMLTNIMNISSTPLTVMKNLVDSALQEFPDCPLLLVTLINLESRSHIFGRLRKFFDRTLKNSSSALTSLCAVASEMLRHKTVTESMGEMNVLQTGISDGGTVHRLRSIFEQVLQKPSSRHCPLLWKLYLTFEAKHGRSNKAKGILYRALQSCPWSKALYMDGIAVFEDVELQEMTDLMTEKEIRVRIPLEEVDLLLTAEKEEKVEEAEELTREAVEDIKEEAVDERKTGEEMVEMKEELTDELTEEMKEETPEGTKMKVIDRLIREAREEVGREVKEEPA
ncbi:nuclear exosome regulator NRDE2 [Aplysia californica]|uniref:Nuclear exosome regulator NRDE2 n=1 Tax=Aplysia californica TaxID=6500 RepID=A0ABM0K292_APLCA|nr:nuclear exosome regulator NRDE2 [Aplysia californica]